MRGQWAAHVARRLTVPAGGAAPSAAQESAAQRAGQTWEPWAEPAVPPHSSRAGATQAGGPRPGSARKWPGKPQLAAARISRAGRSRLPSTQGPWPGRTGCTPHAGVLGRGWRGVQAGQRAAQARAAAVWCRAGRPPACGGDCKAAAGLGQRQGRRTAAGAGRRALAAALAAGAPAAAPPAGAGAPALVVPAAWQPGAGGAVRRGRGAGGRPAGWWGGSGAMA